MRDIPVGNGSLLVTFDDRYRIRDIYFPHVGQENHTEGFPFRFGIWADGDFSWTYSDDWERQLGYLPETLVTNVELTAAELGVSIICNDTVASHENIFLRRVRVINLSDATREIRVFHHHDFRIYENKVGDTAFYDPDSLSVIHYKKHRYFLMKTAPHFDSFATGRKAFRELEGTWRDAENGELSGGAITEGSVDSTIGVHFTLEALGTYEFFYWIAAGTSYAEVTALDRHVIDRHPQKYFDYTTNYWRVWVNKNDTDLSALPDAVSRLYKRSLLIIGTQTDSGGAILAANDSDVTERATDHYSYLWTRDGALVANALDMAGYAAMSRKFFDFCSRIIHPDGYFLQKYNPDGTVASGWHAAWDVAGRRQLVPIQEDETALVIWALWQHYECDRDIDFAHRLYQNLVTRCADFMVGFRDPNLRLPNASWNLWEDRRGIHTFTCCTVAAALRAAANFSRLFAESDRAAAYDTAADEIIAAIREHLYDPEKGRFVRALQFHGDDTYEPDPTIDASLFSLFYFGCFAPDDAAVLRTMQAVRETLITPCGGFARFEGDNYMRAANDAGPNAWFICTLWMAEHYIALARTVNELNEAMNILQWAADAALPSGVLSEQLDPVTGEHISVSPLTWSHSAFVAATANYLRKLKELQRV
jgi:GH15 family glucan-1,4-alpha-glucosidase